MGSYCPLGSHLSGYTPMAIVTATNSVVRNMDAPKNFQGRGRQSLVTFLSYHQSIPLLLMFPLKLSVESPPPPVTISLRFVIESVKRARFCPTF